MLAGFLDDAAAAARFNEAAGVDPADARMAVYVVYFSQQPCFNEAAGVDPADASTALTVAVADTLGLQ